MKKVIFFIFLVWLINMMTLVCLCGNEVQMTDYRYENMARLLGGYTVADYYDSTESETIDGLEKKLFSTIFKPNGEELFKPGKFYIKYTPDLNIDNWQFEFPQSADQKRFVVYDVDTELAGIIDDNGNLLTECKYKNLKPIYNKFYVCSGDGYNERIVVNCESGMEVYKTNTLTSCYYINDEDWILDFHLYWGKAYDGTEGYVIDYTFIDPYGNIAESGSALPAAEFDQKYSSADGVPIGYDSWLIQYDPNVIYDSQGRKYLKTPFVDRVNNDEHKAPLQPYGDLDLNDAGEMTDENFDLTYKFISKEVGGKEYFALFKELGDGESAEEYLCTEEPALWAAEGVKGLRDEGILYNNLSCRYGDNISRLDFAALITEIVCRAKGIDVDRFIEENDIHLNFDRFKDTQDAYVLLACELGIVKGTAEDRFSPDRGISRQEAAVMLYNGAKFLELDKIEVLRDYTDREDFAEWAAEAIFAVGGMKCADGTAVMEGTGNGCFSPLSTYSRQQAYTTAYRLLSIAGGGKQ